MKVVGILLGDKRFADMPISLKISSIIMGVLFSMGLVVTILAILSLLGLFAFSKIIPVIN